MRLRKYIGKGLVVVFLCSLLLAVLFPLLIVAINALKTEKEFYQGGPFALPVSFNLEPLREAATKVGFWQRLWNSFVISVPTAFFATALSLLNGYAMGIGRIRGKTFFLIFFLLAMTLPQEALVYPLYYMFRLVNLYNTRLGVVLCLIAAHLSFGTYLLATVMEEFPRDFVDAAQIDGAGKIYVLSRIVLPLLMPTVSVLFVFCFIWTWNDFFLSLIFLVSQKLQTLPLGILQMQGQYVTNINLQSAVALLLSLPCIIFFLLFQRTLTKGVMASGIKG